MRKLFIRHLTLPAQGEFRISRSALTAFPVIQVEIKEGEHQGRGECRPYARYKETPLSVAAQIESIRPLIETGMSLESLQTALPAGAARNAVDCALWDLRAKQEQRRVWEILGLPEPRARETAFTLSMGTPDSMAKAALTATDYPVLKIKIGDAEPLPCVQAIIAARPEAKLIIDANEALTPRALDALRQNIPPESTLLIEQPLPASDSTPYDPSVLPPICADEALHIRQDLGPLWDAGYRAINMKLDKCGGLTEALALAREAKDRGFTIMAGCMVGSSLAMAPMVMLESFADIIDLDGPLLLSKDIEHGLKYHGPVMHPPSRELWG